MSTLLAILASYVVIKPFYPCIDCGGRWWHRKGYRCGR